MAWGYEASFTIEHVNNNNNKRLRCYDCFYFDDSDKSCGKTPRYLPEDGYDSWKYCGEFEIKPSVSFKDEKLRQYDNWMKDRPPKNRVKHQAVKNSSYTNRVGYNEKSVTKKYVTDYTSVSNKIVKDRKADGLPLLTKQERETLPLVICGFFKRIPRPKTKKVVGIKLDDGTLAQVIVFVSEGKIYYKKHKYPANYVEAIQRVIDNKNS